MFDYLVGLWDKKRFKSKKGDLNEKIYTSASFRRSMTDSFEIRRVPRILIDFRIPISHHR
jgi:hypothetical protein